LRKVALRSIIFSVLDICIISCAWTSMNSQISPECSGRQYRKILVFVDLYDLGDRQSAEIRIKDELADFGVGCLTAHELFFAGRSYSENEMVDLLDRNEVEAVLIIDPYATGESKSYIPPSTRTKTEGTVREGFFGYTFQTKSRTTTSGGYYVSKPWARFTLRLFDAKTGEVVWIASARSRGNAFASWNTLMNSVAVKTVEQLNNDDLLIEAPASEKEASPPRERWDAP